MIKFSVLVIALIAILTLASCGTGAPSEETVGETLVPDTTAEITSHEHSYTETMIDPTCTNAGSVVSECACGDVV